MGKQKNLFIQKAHLKKGAFIKYCKGKGFNGVTNQCINEGIHSKNPHVQHRARLAKTLRSRSMHH